MLSRGGEGAKEILLLDLDLWYSERFIGNMVGNKNTLILKVLTTQRNLGKTYRKDERLEIEKRLFSYFSLVEFIEFQVGLCAMWLFKSVYLKSDEHLYCAVQYFCTAQYRLYTVSQYTNIRAVHNLTAVCLYCYTQT